MKKLLSILFVFVCLATTSAQIIEKPNPPRLVVDEADVLGKAEEDRLEKKLVKYNDSTSTQIQVIFIKSLEGLDIFDYSQKLAEDWGIGQKDKNNGLLILTSIGDRKVRIHPGRGIEDKITDAFSSDIIDNILRPAYKNNQYYQGVDEATTAIIQKLAGTYKADKPQVGWLAPIIIFIIIIVIIVLLSIFNKRGGGNGRGGDGGWLANALLWSALTSGNSHRGGGSWGGGDSSGGFGGWGGGSFGGGGADGSW